MSESQNIAFTEAQLQAVKHKMKVVLAYLVKTHIENGGIYYEVKPDPNNSAGVVYVRSTKAARTIAGLMLPYMLWVVSEYVKRINALDAGFFTFSKKPDLYLENVFHLDFNVEQRAIKNISTILMYMVVVFQDHFESDITKQIPVNRLCYLLVK